MLEQTQPSKLASNSFRNSLRKSRYLLIVLLASAGMLTNDVHANDFDLRISDDALHLNLAIVDDYSALSYGGGYFYKDNDEAIHIVNLDLHSQGQTALGNFPTTVKVGIQGNYFDEDGVDGAAIGLGGSVRINLPDTPGLSWESQGHFAPDVLAFDDAKRFARLSTQLNYRVIQTADLNAGYRYINTKLNDGTKRTFESGWFVGLRLNF